MNRHHQILGIAAIAGALLMTGCTSTDNSADSAASPTTAAAEITLPDTVLGQEAEWVLGQLNDPESLSVTEWEKRLAPSVLEQMTAEELVSVLRDDVSVLGPFTAIGMETENNRADVELLGQNGVVTMLVLTVDPDTKQIMGLYFK